MFTKIVGGTVKKIYIAAYLALIGLLTSLSLKLLESQSRTIFLGLVCTHAKLADEMSE